MKMINDREIANTHSSDKLRRVEYNRWQQILEVERMNHISGLCGFVVNYPICPLRKTMHSQVCEPLWFRVGQGALYIGFWVVCALLLYLAYFIFSG